MTSYTFSPFDVYGCVEAIPSKSVAHRVLIAAALADVATDVVLNGFTSEDIEATIRCIEALGANVMYEENSLCVIPEDVPVGPVEFDCGESGSTLRFMLPVAAARLKDGAVFSGSGRLPSRPLGELCKRLRSNGCYLSADSLPLTLEGCLSGGIFTLPGNISSQFITGLLLALPITPRGGRIYLSSPLESSDYVAMTLQVLETFGITVEKIENGWNIPGNQTYHSPGSVQVDGDWSNAAVMFCAGLFGGATTVYNLDWESLQGDRRIVNFLWSFGATVRIERRYSPGMVKMFREAGITKDFDGFGICASAHGGLHGVTLDMSENPDLFPVLAVVAAAAEGRTILANAKRVRMKECDRLSGMAEMLTAVGANVTETDDSLIIDGGASLHGAHVNVHNDHRLVMAAALLSLAAKADIEVDNVEAVNKSYPRFLRDWKKLKLELPEVFDY